MRIAIVTAQVPFVRGGAEVHAAGLRVALERAGHDVDLVCIPFKWYPPEAILDHMLSVRLLDLSEANGTPVDLVIGLKFPAYYVRHPNKVIWVLHQHRDAYDLWQRPLGALHRYAIGSQVRQAIQRADGAMITEARAVFANSANVARRLWEFNGITAQPLYHPPPNASLFYSDRVDDYIFFPSRLTQIKRQWLVLEALKRTQNAVRVQFAGAPDAPRYQEELLRRAQSTGVDDRVEWLGQITEERKREKFAKALAVIYPPEDEDYGYVTMEAMLSAKPVITCTDSGGPLEFVRHRVDGMIVPPTPEAVAAAMDEIWELRDQSASWGEAGRQRYQELDISWDRVVDRLLA